MKKILSNKRELLKGAGVTALWASPVVSAVLLPAHAVATPTRPGSTPTKPGSTPSNGQNLQVEVVYNPGCFVGNDGSPWVANNFVVTVTSSNGTQVQGLATRLRYTLFTVRNNTVRVGGAFISGTTGSDGTVELIDGSHQNLARIRQDYEAVVTGPDGQEYTAFGSTDSPFGCPGTPGSIDSGTGGGNGDDGANPEFVATPMINVTCPSATNSSVGIALLMSVTSTMGSSVAGLPIEIEWELFNTGSTFSGSVLQGTTNGSGISEFAQLNNANTIGANPNLATRLDVIARVTAPSGRVYVGRRSFNAPFGC